MSHAAQVSVRRLSGYRFLVDFGDDMPSMLADEPAPLGTDTGPSPSQMLLSAVANCLSASLLFALQKFKQDPGELSATASAEMGRDENNRLRIVGIRVQLRLGRPAAELEQIERVLAQFEAFCTVSMSVQRGVSIAVAVSDSTGAVLKG